MDYERLYDDNMQEFHDSSDWSYIFKEGQWASNPRDCTKIGMPPIDRRITMDDIEVVYCLSNGMNDDEPWYGLFKLKPVYGQTEGDYLYVDAWCDYSGWG